MKRGFALACAAAFALAGCVTEPETGTGIGEPAVAAIVTLLQKASPASLREAAGAIAALKPAGGSKASDLAGLGRELYATLYPEMLDNPFAPNAQSPTYGPLFTGVRQGKTILPVSEERDFFRLIVPCLVLLDPAAPIPADTLDALEADVRRADGLSGRMSVLPPHLLGLLAERRGPAGASEALSLYRASVQRDSSFYPGQEKTARLLVAAKKAEEAVTILEGLSASFPHDASLLKVLSQAYLDSGRSQQALDASARGLLISPDDSGIALIRAKAFEQTGDWYQALRVLDLLLKRSPDAIEAILEKARVLAKSADNVEEAVKVLLDAEARFPTDPAFPELEGSILLDAGRGDEGLKSLNRALELLPDRLSTLKLLLEDAMKTRRWMQAKSYVEHILTLSETHDILLLAYRVSWNLGEYGQAAAYAKTLVDGKSPDNPRFLLAAALHAQGNDAEALLTAQAGIAEAQSPRDKSRYRSLLASLESAANPEKAVQELRSALMDDPDNLDALVLLSDLLAARGEYHGALLYAKHASELSPEDAVLKVKIAEYEKKSKPQEQK